MKYYLLILFIAPGAIFGMDSEEHTVNAYKYLNFLYNRFAKHASKEALEKMRGEAYVQNSRPGRIKPSGILFMGSPRTGKSVLAEELASELKKELEVKAEKLGFNKGSCKGTI